MPGKKRLPFGDKNVIAIGDLCQLPPVPLRLFGVVYNNCAVYVLALWGYLHTHELRENFRPKGDPEMQRCLDELHDGVVGGSARDVLLQRIVRLPGMITYRTPHQTPSSPPVNRHLASSPTRRVARTWEIRSLIVTKLAMTI